MKTNKTIVGFSIVLALACLFQLSFTWKAQGFEKEAKAFAAKAAEKGGDNKEAYRRYIDSLGNQEIYSVGIAGFTYFECKQREINLGLDLRGGMNVILEVDKGAVVKVLSNDSKDRDLNRAIDEANVAVRDNGADFVKAFVASFKKNSPSRNMANLFAKGNKGVIQSNSSEGEVLNYLDVETKSAIDRVYEVVEKRINQSNVTQPTIQKIDGGRISVELPGVDNPRRMEELVEKSAKLEFYEVYGNDGQRRDGTRILNALYKASKMSAAPITEVPDSASMDSGVVNTTDGPLASSVATSPAATTTVADSPKVADNKKKEAKKDEANGSPLAKVLKSFGNDGPGSAIAVVKKADRAVLGKMLEDERYAAVLRIENAKVAYSAKPRDFNADGKEAVNSDEYFVYFLKLDRDGNAALSAEDDNIISDARVNTSPTGELEVSMEMTSKAGTQWAQVTGRNIGKYIAVVLDERVYSAPVVNQKISGGNSQITGNFDIREANDLANVLKAGKLPAPAKIVASEQVGASLGQDSIDRGLNSLLFGFITTILFMVLYYSRAGWMAIVAVLGNVFLIMGVLASMGAALTLPGIAGIILTVGMAVDANVLIYERIKDELAAGKGMKTAIADGFKRAMSAIVDSNITTLLAGFILTFAGAGPAYGFAIILVIGIFSSMFTALFITRLLLDRRADKGLEISFDAPWNKSFLKNSNIDFVSNRKKYYMASGFVILVGLIAFISKGGINTGIDFKGGYSYVVQFDASKKYQIEDIKVALDNAMKGSSNEVKTFGNQGQFRLVTTYMIDAQGQEGRDSVRTAVLTALKGFKLADGDPILSSSKVGAAIATSTRDKSAFLVILAVVGIFLYIVFRFRSIAYGMGATVALIHDVLVVLSFFAILDGVVPFPTDFDQHLIAALLTLLGYSMNDTVIVFDRIREFLTSKRVDRNDEALINTAINDTLSRTIITAATVFVVVLILFLFGGDALKGFSLALLIGVVVGTYSSICIATPIVVDFSSKKKQIQ
ncbi:MAG: protein translocase subunit SecDF [Bacteroidetes bacterium]|nr:protein translocase subunit SecDF [Bacteroidota bacterium]MDA1224493.1 protein translocase subunit SecDF [Bacteroidota bacterium]